LNQHHSDSNEYTETTVEKIMHDDSKSMLSANEMSLMDKIRLFDRNRGIAGNDMDNEFFLRQQLQSTRIAQEPNQDDNNNADDNMYVDGIPGATAKEKKLEPNDFIDKNASILNESTHVSLNSSTETKKSKTVEKFKNEPNDVIIDEPEDAGLSNFHIKASYRNTTTQPSPLSQPSSPPSSQVLLRHELYHHTNPSNDSHYQNKTLVIASQD
jgi:hypothetical protein